MKLDELQFCRKLLDQGVPLEKATIRRVVEHALNATVRLARLEVQRHDDSCRWWVGAGCDCREADCPALTPDGDVR